MRLGQEAKRFQRYNEAMATNPEENGYTCAMHWTNSGDAEPMISTFGVKDNSPGRTPDTVANLIATAIDNGDITAGEIMCVGWTYTGFTLTQTLAAGDLVVERPATVDGDNAVSGLPSNCALLIKKLTASGGRRNRGRFYFPAAYLPEATVSSNGDLDNTLVANYQARFDNFLTELSGADLPMVVWHELAPLTGTVVTTLTVQSKIATQRRRMR